jgi:hypothetical protein
MYEAETLEARRGDDFELYDVLDRKLKRIAATLFLLSMVDEDAGLVKQCLEVSEKLFEETEDAHLLLKDWSTTKTFNEMKEAGAIDEGPCLCREVGGDTLYGEKDKDGIYYGWYIVNNKVARSATKEEVSNFLDKIGRPELKAKYLTD